MAKKLLTVDGKPRPKGKPRGVPGAPHLAAYRFKPGHTFAAKRRVRISEEVHKELRRIEDGMTQGTALARGLVERAKKDSSELERVIRITEPNLLQPEGGGNLNQFAFQIVYDEQSKPALAGELVTTE